MRIVRMDMCGRLALQTRHGAEQRVCNSDGCEGHAWSYFRELSEWEMFGRTDPRTRQRAELFVHNRIVASFHIAQSPTASRPAALIHALVVQLRTSNKYAHLWRILVRRCVVSVLVRIMTMSSARTKSSNSGMVAARIVRPKVATSVQGHPPLVKFPRSWRSFSHKMAR